MKIKKLFLALGLTMISVSAFADSVTFKVPAFSGEMAIEGTGYEVTEIRLEARNQFCNFWGTTCAGGPSEEAILEVSAEYRESGGKTWVDFTSPTDLKLKSRKIAHDFSSCNLILNIYLQEADGRLTKVWAPLFASNDKSKCESEGSVLSAIERYLNEGRVHRRF